MKRIEEQLQWYQQNASSCYDDLVSIELEKINMLYDRYEDHSNEMFVEEMIESFCKIIERQRERIHDIEGETNLTVPRHTMLAQDAIMKEDFQNDKQLQEVFTAYCLNNGKSSYTVNDYCSRIKNLWKSFYEEYQSGKLPEELAVIEEKVKSHTPLLNVYNHIDEINCYVSMKIAENEGNRNWANARAAFNKLDEFRTSIVNS